jgi:hypothetical protein
MSVSKEAATAVIIINQSAISPSLLLKLSDFSIGSVNLSVM